MEGRWGLLCGEACNAQEAARIEWSTIQGDAIRPAGMHGKVQAPVRRRCPR